MMILSNIRICTLLVWREIIGMRSNFFDMLINACLFASSEALVYGYFMPQFGMPKSIVPLMYMGTIMGSFTSIGVERLFRDAFDLTTNRFIDYQLTLPISRFWLFVAYIISYMIDLTFKTICPMFLGFFIINSIHSFSHVALLPLFAMHFITVLFCSLFFMTLSYAWSSDWLVDHLWPRFLIPLLTFSSSWYPWYNVNIISPFWGSLFLLNPATYIVEGFRVALLGSSQAVPLDYCIIFLGSCCCALSFLLARVVKKRLDFV